jgi:hypothetical protein
MKWYDDIGFRVEVEQEPGVWEPKIETRKFYGDIVKEAWKEQQGDSINPNLLVTNRVSIVADPYLLHNFHKIAFIKFLGAKWKVSNVDVNSPRLILSLGDLYLEEEEEDG